MEVAHRLCIPNHGYYYTEYFKPRILHGNQRHANCCSANRKGSRTKEGTNEGRKEAVMPNRGAIPVFVWSAETKQSHHVRTVYGPANVRTFQIQVQDVTSHQTLHTFNKININPSTTKCMCLSVQCSPASERTLLFKRSPAFARLSW